MRHSPCYHQANRTKGEEGEELGRILTQLQHCCKTHPDAKARFQADDQPRQETSQVKCRTRSRGGGEVGQGTRVDVRGQTSEHDRDTPEADQGMHIARGMLIRFE